MGVRSLGNSLASFGYKFGRTGLEAAGPNIPVGVSGGNVDGLDPGNGYTYHTFTSSGALTVSGTPIPSCEILMVGGGGGVLSLIHI